MTQAREAAYAAHDAAKVATGAAHVRQLVRLVTQWQLHTWQIMNLGLPLMQSELFAPHHRQINAMKPDESSVNGNVSNFQMLSMP